MSATPIAIDFGTSNTAAAVLKDGKPHLLSLESGQNTVPTAIFLNYARRDMLIGSAAVRAMIDGEEGRFMRALKSILGTPLARERRQFLNRRMTLLEIIAAFLAQVRARAEAETGERIVEVIAGRPVHFHSADAARDAQAEVDLAECYRMAGFSAVRFLAEPEAAARAAGADTGLGLIVDIGGGTSDFTLFRSTGAAPEIVASHGVRIGGTDFDKVLNLAYAMPLFGLGGELRNEIGPGRHAVPQAIFHDLASWEKIAFLYGPATLRDAKLMARMAVTPRPLARLAQVLELEQGHDIAFAVEAAKIGANDAGQATIDLTEIEKGLAPTLYRDDLGPLLWPLVSRVDAAVTELLDRTGIPASDVGRVVFVGGSSLIGVIDAAMRARFPGAGFERSEVFTAVVDGLALASADGV
ncbi:MAG: Hsp70 family protein [Albidovulum sp.]